jgi:hypothetical protein
MHVKRSLVSAALAAGLALSLVACNGGSDTGSSSTPSAMPTPTPTPTTSSTTPTVAPTTPAAPKPRTKAELTKALLAIEDLPTGLAIDNSGDEGDGGMSSKDSRCADVVKLFNADTAPGSTATVKRSFTGGQNGPFIEEDLDAMPSAPAATALVNRARAAVRSCKQVTLKITGVGSSPAQISEVAAPKVGSARFGVRFSATSGPLEGLELTFVIASLGDVVLGMSFDDPSQIEGAVTAAVGKAGRVLGTPKAGA